MILELHIYMTNNCWHIPQLLTTLAPTEMALNCRRPTVHTTQPHVCSTTWLLKGYRIFVHLLNETTIELRLGKNECTDRFIRVTHNLEKLLLANEFGPATIETDL